MIRKSLSRRAFLRGAGGTLVALPLLQAMESKGQALMPDKRFMTVFVPNGVEAGGYWPTNVTSETNFTLGSSLTSLASHKNDLLIIDGLRNRAAETSNRGDHHQRGIGAFLTNQHLGTEPLFVSGASGPPDTGWANGISLDQKIANHFYSQAPTAVRSIVAGVYSDSFSNGVIGTTSYAAPKQPVMPVNDPAALFNSLFSGFSLPPNQALEQNEKRKRIVDAIKPSFDRLLTKVGVEDQSRVQQHVAAIDDLETQLENFTVEQNSCTVPTLGTVPDISFGAQHDVTNFDAVAKLQIDLCVAAMVCGQTRVASLMLSKAVSNTKYSNLQYLNPSNQQLENIDVNHHSITHGATGISSGQKTNMLRAIDTFQYGLVKYLLDKCAAVTEVDGSRLLDNMVILVGNELHNGPSHTLDRMPFMLAGNCQNYFNTGRVVDVGDVYHSRLLVTLQNAMGITDTTFGHPNYQGGALSQLTT